MAVTIRQKIRLQAELRGPTLRISFQISMLPFNNYNTLCPSFYSASSLSPVNHSTLHRPRHL
eukprot:1144545-Pelagomonas_calceolata.AAC.8